MQSQFVKDKVDWKQNAKKRHNTMKKNGSYSLHESESELRALRSLREEFGESNVVQHIQLDAQDIDLYVQSLDVYVQVDGVYWHGLDRPLDVIKQLKFERDASILSAFDRDKCLAEFVKKNKKKLVRVTDKQVNLWVKENRLREKLAALVRAA